MTLKAETVGDEPPCDCPNCQAIARNLKVIGKKIPSMMRIVESLPDQSSRMGLLTSLTVNVILAEFPESALLAMFQIQEAVFVGLSTMGAVKDHPSTVPGVTNHDVGHA